MNSPLHAIEIYRHNGGWAFDDLKHGLVAEALIEGADTLVDRILEQMPEGQKTQRALIRFIDGVHVGGYWLGHVGRWIILKKVGESNDGTDYVVLDEPFDGHRVWLCSALLCYFAVAPRAISLDLRPLSTVPTQESAFIVSRMSLPRP